jgi:hypothetical protein
MILPSPDFYALYAGPRSIRVSWSCFGTGVLSLKLQVSERKAETEVLIPEIRFGFGPENSEGVIRFVARP